MASNSADYPKPKDLVFDTIIEDICCHPVKNVIAAGSIDGDVTVHSYSLQEENHELMSFDHHKKACRVLRFSEDGERLYTASKDKSLCVIDMNNGVVSERIKKAHESAIYSMLVVDKNIVVTGDDDGYLKVWDLRYKKTVMEIKENEEFISDMIIDDAGRMLIATSGDGTLTAFNIRKHKMEIQSEILDSELLSIEMMKNGEKVVCGSGDGIINIFNWSEWGNISDRFPGHPLSIDCIVPITEDIICTGSIDGIVRAVNILPNRFLGTVGNHEEYPVENMSKTHDGKLLASCSHDQKIKFWNIEKLYEETVDTHRKKAKKTNKPKNLNVSSSKDDFFSDLVDEKNEQKDDGSNNKDSDDESDDDDNDKDGDDDDNEIDSGDNDDEEK